MFKWTPYPFVRLTMAFTLGILAYHLFNASVSIYFLFLCWPAYYILKAFRNAIPYYNIMSGITGLFIIACMGIYACQIHFPQHEENHLLNHQDKIKYIYGSVKTPGSPTKHTIKTLLEVHYIKAATEWLPASGKVFIYQRKSDSVKVLKAGNEIMIKGSPERIHQHTNPGAFDYKEYMAGKGIFHQIFCSPAQIKLSSTSASSNDFNPLTFINEIRDSADSLLNASLSWPGSLDIARALIIGKKSNIDDELRENYADAGAMHMLAVSGLHVGIIYLVTLFLLKPLQHHRKGKWAWFILILTVIWFYACFTGLSSSVLRASTMFSFIHIGRFINRKTSVINTLAASAFILLCFNPSLIYDVGFQLSYSAVAGIVIMQPYIYNLWQPGYFLADKIWELACVSISAQIATLPIVLYYFHQFPTYFLLSNTIIVPFVPLMVSLGLLTIMFYQIPVISNLLGLVLEYIIYGANYIVEGIASLPGSTIAPVNITLAQTIILFLLIGLIIIFVTYKNLKILIWATISALCFNMISVYTQWQSANQVFCIFYYDGKHQVVDFIKGNQSTVYSMNTLPDNFKKYTLTPAHRHYHIHNTRYDTIYNAKRIFFSEDVSDNKRLNKGIKLKSFFGETFLFIKSWPENLSLQKKLAIDQLIISNNSISYQQITENFSFQNLIITADNDHFFSEELHNNLIKKDFNVHNIKKEGPFILNLRDH